MLTYDAIVVGAGPAGSSCAKEIAASGKKVLLLEKREKVGVPMQCAGGLGVNMLEEAGIDLPERVIENKVSQVTIFSQNNECEIRARDLGLPCLAYTLDREAFDQHLADEAVEAGAKLITRAEAFEVNPTGVKTKKMAFKSSVVVGAWGPRLDGVSLSDVHVGFQKEVAARDYEEDLISLWFDSRYAPLGYVWAFPIKSGRVRVGLGVPLSVGKPNVFLEKFLKDHPVFQGETTRVSSGLIPTGLPPRSCIKDGIPLVGDAAPVCNPLHGGGIAHAIMSGKTLGKIIATDRPLSEYDVELEPLKKKLKRFYKLKKLLCSYDNKKFDELVSALSEFKISSLDQEKELRRLVSFLIVKKPFLLMRFAAKVF